MNPKTLKTLVQWAKLNGKKLRNIKKIYLAAPTEKRAECLSEIEKDLHNTINVKAADTLEKNIAKRNLCPSCMYNGKYPICAPSLHKKIKDNQGNILVLQCRNYAKVGSDEPGNQD